MRFFSDPSFLTDLALEARPTPSAEGGENKISPEKSMAQPEVPVAAEPANPLAVPEAKTEFDYDLHCFHCNAKFGYILNGRHHCRACGASVCWQHSILNDKGERESRVCAPEFKEICEKNKILAEKRAEIRGQSAAIISGRTVVVEVAPASPPVVAEPPVPEVSASEAQALISGRPK